MFYIDGKWKDDDQAVISARDIIVLRGFGIFDFLRTYGKKPFRLEDHIERFFNSARLMGMTPTHSKDQIKEIVREGIEICGFAHTNIKLIQTGGVSPDGFTPAEKQTFFMYFYEAIDYPKEMYEKGIALQISTLLRQNPQAKTVNYAASIAEVQQVKKEGFVDILHTDASGNIYEATRSNFFAVKHNTLITAQVGILEGITRKVILELADRGHIPVEKRFVTIDELPEIDEAFVSNSSQEIVPVVKVDSHRIGDGRVGKLTKRLMKELRDSAEQ